MGFDKPGNPNSATAHTHCTHAEDVTEYIRADLAPAMDGLRTEETVHDLVQWAMDRPHPLAAISEHKAWIAEARRILTEAQGGQSDGF